MIENALDLTMQFLSTPSARRATLSIFASKLMICIFLSTPSARRATPCRRCHDWRYSDFYPRPPRGGRLVAGIFHNSRKTISIHALREEGDYLRHSRRQ